MRQLATLDQQLASIRAKRLARPYGEGASPDDLAEYNFMCLSAIDRLTRPYDFYYTQAQAELRRSPIDSNGLTLALSGIISCLKRDIQEGFFPAFEEMVSSSLLSDFLDTAVRLLSQSRAETGAVIVAGVLEVHLRRLAVKYHVSVYQERIDQRVWRRLKDVNDDLSRIAYGDDEHQSVARLIAIHDYLRGEASYPTGERLKVAVTDLRTFIENHPA